MANAENQVPESGNNDGGLGGLRTDVLAGTTHKASDLNMVRRAVRERWGIPKEKRPAIVDRMLKIVGTQEVVVEGREESYVSTDAADKNAIQAARVLVAMEGQNQADEHLDAKNERLDSGKPTENVGVKYIKGVDDSSV